MKLNDSPRCMMSRVKKARCSATSLRWATALVVLTIFSGISAQSGTSIDPPRPLTDRGLQNLIAFAKLYGIVRYFHPSEQAATTDWDSFVTSGLREVESAPDELELANTLRNLFSRVAPTVRILTDGQRYILPAELRLTADNLNGTVIYWRHHGPGTSSQADIPYRSERVRASALEAHHAKLPVPDMPWIANLGGGVTAYVPLALFEDSREVLPHTTDTVPRAANRSPWSADDRNTRLADVIIAWNVFEHFYPYFDVVKTDWTAVLPSALMQAAVDQNESAFTKTLQRVIAELHDGHGVVYNVASTKLPALPLRWDWVEGQLTITAVSSSIQGQIAPGDVVVSIQGRPVAEALADEESLVSGATSQWIRYRALQRLRFRRSDESSAENAIELEIQPFRTPGTTAKVLVSYVASPPPEELRPEKIAEIQPGIYYVDITRISDSEYQSVMPKLEKAQGIVFDSRGYPSKLTPTFLTHLSDKPLKSAQWHTPVLIWPDRHRIEFERRGEWLLQPAEPLLSAKKAFIVDARAISYAESCMGIVEYYKIGNIVGAPTAGTNGNVSMFSLPGGYIISWTGMKVLKHDGTRHHGVGIIPTIPVSRTRAGIASGHDELLERAIESVSK